MATALTQRGGESASAISAGNETPRLIDLLAALRPLQWIKNSLLFGALLSSGQVISLRPVLADFVAFIAFCAAASAGYLLNDVLDRATDMEHPAKRLRPVAAGKVTPASALALAGALAIAALGLAAAQSWALLAVIAGYLVMQTAYCLWLKHQEILDVVVVATGFLLRAIAGGVAARIHLTPWFFAVVGFGALFVVVGKRASEVNRVSAGAGGRDVAKLYTPTFLRSVGMMAMTVTVVTYCVWAFARYESGAWLLAVTVVPFVIAVLRYGQIVDAGIAEAPERALLTDRLIRVAGVAWGLLFAAHAIQDASGRFDWSFVRYLLLAAVSVMLAWTGWAISWRLGLRRWSELLIGTVVLATSEVVLISLTIGQVPGGFRAFPLSIAVVALAAVGSALGGRQALRAAIRLNGAGLRHLATYPVRHTLVAVFGLLLMAAYAARLLVALRLPNLDYDGLWYHLIGPDTWVIDGQITRPRQVIWSEVYPSDMEIVMAWPGVFTRNMWLASSALFASYGVAVAAVAAIARRLGARRAGALLAGLIFAAVPSVISFASTAYVDVSLAAWVLSGCVFLAGIRQTARPAGIFGRLLVGGAAVGLAAGTKTSGLVVLAVLGTGLAIWLIWWARQSRAIGQAIAMLLAFCTPVLALAAFWYVRNWLYYGNPFYPISMFGFPGRGTVGELFMVHNTPDEILNAPGGMLGGLWESWRHDFIARHEVYWARLGGMGSFWMPIVLPAAFSGIVLTLRRDGRSAVRATLLLAVAVTVLVSSPAPWWPRYILATAGIVIAMGAVAIDRLGRWPFRFVTVSVIALSVFSNAGVIQDPATHMALQQRPDITRLFGWDRFADYARLPAGSTIGFVRPDKEALMHPMVGMDLQRRVVVLEPVRDLPALDAEIRRAGADYLVLDQDNPLYALVSQAPDRYRRIYSAADADFDWPVVYKHRLYQILPNGTP